MSAVVPPDDRSPADAESVEDLDRSAPRIVTQRYILTLGQWGAELESSPQSDDLAWRPDAVPAIALPPAPEFFLDREDLMQDAIAALPSERPVVLCGAPGSGKTTLLHHCAHHPELADTFAGGILYLDVQDLSVEDIAQTVYDRLTSAAHEVKIESDRLRSLLKELSVLILLDNTTGTQSQVEALTKIIPFVICTAVQMTKGMIF
ncbi:MAG: NB-ARC domain-containing protein, partial [Cyanobacteria bacterium J06648_11]